MKLNSDKTQVMVISTSKEDLDWKPTLSLNGKQLAVVDEYRFLGVVIDSGLRFTAHFIAKCRRRNNILRCMAGKDWGQSLESQKTLYATYIRSAIEYASPSWFPWISESSKKALERVQNESLRIMSRMAKDTPCDFLRLQTGVEKLESRLEKNSKVIRERYERLKETDSRRMIANRVVKTRLTTRKGWRAATEDVAKMDICRDMEKAIVKPMKPWNIEITEVELEKTKGEYSTEELRAKSDQKIAEIAADVEIYTDGSTDGAQRNGGAGIFIQDRFSWKGRSQQESCVHRTTEKV